MKNVKGVIIIFLKGLLMGICDIIPGISGGTIAFITGIYERLINGVKNYNPLSLYLLFKRFFNNKIKFKEDFKKLDIIFFIPLILGIIIAFIIGSNILPKLLQNYFTQTISFFSGLIISSSGLIYKEIKDHKIKDRIFGIVGLIIGIILAFLVPANIAPTYLFIFFSGILAIMAMFLPGISGAFILLILGQYEFMLNVVHNIRNNIKYFFSFIAGALIGVFVISKAISWLLKKYHAKTLYFLLGLVIGSLSIPLRNIYNHGIIVNPFNIFKLLIFIMLGVLIVYIFNKTAERIYHKDFIGIKNKD